MIGDNVREYLDSISGVRMLEALYGPDAVAQEQHRYRSLVDGMAPQAGFPVQVPPGLRVFSAPGRTELGGNHTDHNRGRVLAAAIQMDAIAIAAPRSDRQVFFRSAGFPDVAVNLAAPDGKLDLSPKPEERGTSEALVRGIADEFAQQGIEPGGFSANAASTVLPGSGLSSSAAVEVLIAKIFDSLYGGGRLSAVELAQISQKAENRHFGKPCGLMDQAASASGGAVAIDFADPAAPILKKIEFDPLVCGFALCVVNTRGNHADLTPDYAAIPQEMNAVARYFGKNVLRELDCAQVLAHIGEIRKSNRLTISDRALLRAIHFFNEDQRADAMAALLQTIESTMDMPEKQKLMGQFLDLVNESGASSWELLQNIFSPRDPLRQEIALALVITKEFFREQGYYGACRVHGGGFAGTIQAYIPVTGLGCYRERMDALFGPGAVTVLRIRSLGAIEIGI